MTTAERIRAAQEAIAKRSGEEFVARLLEAGAEAQDAPGGVQEILVSTHRGRMTDVHLRTRKRIGA